MICCYCGNETNSALEMCAWHDAAVVGDLDGETNRALCNFFHRQRRLSRVPLAERTAPAEETWL